MQEIWGKKAFDAPWKEGRTMTAEQALAAQGRTLVPTDIPVPRDAISTPPTKSPTTYPAGLTAREMEVLRLVAMGMTNEQVAEQLVISPRTVNTHLTAIYGKIGISSRSTASRSFRLRGMEADTHRHSHELQSSSA
jgi:DNA-binding NarL/FixJ family response regulator